MMSLPKFLQKNRLEIITKSNFFVHQEIFVPTNHVFKFSNTLQISEFFSLVFMRLQVGLLTASSDRYWRQWQVCFVSLLYIVMYSQCTPETGEMVVYICTPRTRTIVISVGFRDHCQQQLFLQPPLLKDNIHLTYYYFFLLLLSDKKQKR